MFNKRGMVLSEIIGLFLFVIVFFAAGSAVAGVVGWALSRENPEDVSSVESFENLVDEINSLIDSEGVYANEDDVLMYLGERFIIVGFDKGQNSIPMFFGKERWFTEDENKEDLPRPQSCVGACLCLIKTIDGADDGANSEDVEERYNLPGARCISFDDNVHFYSLNEYLFCDKDSWKFGQTRSTYTYKETTLNGFSPFLFNYGESRNIGFSSLFRGANSVYVTLDSNFGSYLGSLLSDDGPYYSYTVLGGKVPYSGRNDIQGEYADSHILGVRLLYIDKVDYGELKNSGDDVYILITLSENTVVGEEEPYIGNSYTNYLSFLGFDYDDASLKNPLTITNMIVDFRKIVFERLMPKSSVEYSNMIKNANNNDLKIYYFLDFYDWADNNLLFTDSERDDKIKELGSSTLENVKDAIQARIDYCETLPDSSKQICLLQYIDDCSVDHIPDINLCEEIMANPVEIKPEDLKTILVQWIGEIDPAGELKRKINDAKALEENSYNEAYQAYMQIINDNFKNSTGGYDLDAVRVSQLFFMASALELKQADYDVVARFFVDNKTLYQVNTSNETRYVFVSEESKLIVSNSEDITLPLTFEEFASYDGILLDNIQNKREGSKELIYLTMEVLTILDGKGCIQFTPEDFTFIDNSDQTLCQAVTIVDELPISTVGTTTETTTETITE